MLIVQNQALDSTIRVKQDMRLDLMVLTMPLLIDGQDRMVRMEEPGMEEMPAAQVI